MQSDIKEVYKLTSARTGKPEQIYKDIGNFIQQETYNSLKKPKSLIIKLKGVGFWFLRKKRMEKVLKSYPPYYEIEGYSEFDSESAFLKFVNKQELYKIFKARLEDYKGYLLKKQEVNRRRNEFNAISESKENGSETCKD